jgi:hypothetical protein
MGWTSLDKTTMTGAPSGVPKIQSHIKWAGRGGGGEGDQYFSLVLLVQFFFYTFVVLVCPRHIPISFFTLPEDFLNFWTFIVSLNCNYLNVYIQKALKWNMYTMVLTPIFLFLNYILTLVSVPHWWLDGTWWNIFK